MKRILISLLAVMLLATAFAAPVAADDTSYLAGKPTNGKGFGEGSTCPGTAYGRVNGSMVLFVVRHCNNNHISGLAKFGPSGESIGTIGYPPLGFNAAAYDMAWIVLPSGQWPTYRNRVYVGNSYYDMDTEIPRGETACDDLSFSDTMKTGYSEFKSGPHWGPYTGHANEEQGSNSASCWIGTNIVNDQGGEHIPSGAPLWDWSHNSLIGPALGNQNGYTTFTSWRTPMIRLREIYGTTDTFFCANPACTNT